MKTLTIPTKDEQKLAQKSMATLSDVAQKHSKPNEALEIEIAGEEQHIRIPASAFHFLNTIIEHIAEGRAISIIPSDAEVSTMQAAELLNVSRPHVVKLLEQKKIPFHKVGKHRRIKLKDLTAYKNRQAKERSKILNDLAKQAQELEMGY